MYLSLCSIGIGAMLGAWLRWGISSKINPLFNHLAFGTVLVNLIGAFIIGFAVSYFSNTNLNPQYKLFLVTGFCGALTTFSTFSIEVVELLQSSKFEYAAFTILLHVLGSLLFTILGIFSYQLITQH